MKNLLGLALLLLLAVTPVAAQKVHIDYAHDFDFNSVKTFQYVETKDTNMANPMMAERLVNLINREMKEGGLKMVDSDPDIYVTYHSTSQDNTVFNTTNYGYGGYRGGWGGWGGYGGYGGGMSTTTASTYTEGTLIIDAYDAEEKKMVWRGTGTVTVKDKPEKQIKQVEKILSKLGKKWDKILAGQGK